MSLAERNHLEELLTMLFDFVKGDREIEEVTEVMTEEDEEFFGTTKQELREKVNGFPEYDDIDDDTNVLVVCNRENAHEIGDYVPQDAVVITELVDNVVIIPRDEFLRYLEGRVM